MLQNIKNTNNQGVHDGVLHSVYDVAEWLGQVKKLDEMVNAKLAERSQLMDLATRVTPNTDGMPHGARKRTARAVRGENRICEMV